MSIVCIERPNRKRKRTYTAKDCGRIVCRAIETGADKNKVRSEVEKCFGDLCQKEKVRNFLNLLDEAVVAISIALAIAQALTVSLRFLTLIAKRLPLLRVRLGGRAEKVLLEIDRAQNLNGRLPSEIEGLRKVLNITKQVN